jgi:hypothetical protein
MPVTPTPLAQVRHTLILGPNMHIFTMFSEDAAVSPAAFAI